MTIPEKNAPSIDFAEIVEKMGGAETIREGLRDFSRRIERMDARRDELKELYPDKWVALLDDGRAIAGDSLGGVLRELDEKGISRKEAVVKLMETNPSVIIL